LDPVDLAGRIVGARAESRVLAAPVDHGLTPEDAYRIQELVLEPRITTGGGRGGWKLGYTSAVMREQMGVAEPNYGPLARAMILDGSTSEGACVSAGVTQPKVEPEIAAVLGYDVPADATLDGVRECVRSWHLALEIVDSVWEGYRFDWALNTADGSSAAFVVLGPALQPQEGQDGIDLSAIDIELSRNGEPQAQGRSDAAMGDPVRALHWLSQRLADRDEVLMAGDVVITGGLTKAIDLAVKDVVSAHVTAPVAHADVAAAVLRT
jgi:2-keto-4-pentenoate hydratase